MQHIILSDIKERIIECINTLLLVGDQSEASSIICNGDQSVRHCNLLYHLIAPKDGLYVRLIVATWCNVWTHAHGMYNAAIKYEIIVLAYILQEIGDLEWNKYIYEYIST